MDIDYLIDRLEALIQTGKRVPLSNRVMIDEQECYALIDQMRAVVPEEIKAAKRTLNDRERILDEADDTARQIIEQAEQERTMMINQEGLSIEAERQRDIILSEANQESYELRNHSQSIYDEAVVQTQEMREGANQYAMQVLQELETLLDKHLTVVRNGLQNFIQQSQHYQQQIDEYQRQYRPQYTAPAKPELPNTTPKRATNTASPTKTTGNGSAPVKPASNASNGATPTKPRAIAPVEQLPAEQPISRPKTAAAAVNQNSNGATRPAAAANGGTQNGAAKPNISPLRPVPKSTPRPADENEPDDDFDDDLIDEPAPLPRKANNAVSSVGSRQNANANANSRPARPPF